MDIPTTQPKPATVAVGSDGSGSASGLRTVNDLLREIPKRWHSAEIVIGNSIGHVVKVRRVSLQKNANGRRVVMIHESDFS